MPVYEPQKYSSSLKKIALFDNLLYTLINHFYTPQEYVRRYREYFDDDGALDVLV